MLLDHFILPRQFDTAIRRCPVYREKVSSHSLQRPLLVLRYTLLRKIKALLRSANTPIFPVFYLLQFYAKPFPVIFRMRATDSKALLKRQIGIFTFNQIES